MPKSRARRAARVALIAAEVWGCDLLKCDPAGCRCRTIGRRVLQDYSLAPRVRRFKLKLTPAKMDVLKELLTDESLTYAEIAEALGVSKHYVPKVAQALGHRRKPGTKPRRVT